MDFDSGDKPNSNKPTSVPPGEEPTTRLRYPFRNPLHNVRRPTQQRPIQQGPTQQRPVPHNRLAFPPQPNRSPHPPLGQLQSAGAPLAPANKPTAPAKKSTKWWILGGVVVVVAALGTTGFFLNKNGTFRTIKDNQPQTKTVISETISVQSPSSASSPSETSTTDTVEAPHNDQQIIDAVHRVSILLDKPNSTFADFSAVICSLEDSSIYLQYKKPRATRKRFSAYEVIGSIEYKADLATSRVKISSRTSTESMEDRFYFFYDAGTWKICNAKKSEY